MEKWALALSVIAIFVSLLEIYHNGKMNKTNIKSEYFSEFYKTYLFEQIPKARNELRINNGSLVGFEYLQETVTDMVSKLTFFRFADEDFYNKLKKKCFSLEDYLLTTGNKKNVDISDVYKEVDKKLKKIYKHINKKREIG